MDPILLAQVFTCFFMTGLIWLVQLVHYPAFRFGDANRFAELHDFHSRRITWIVLPAMSVELLSAAALAWINRNAFWLINLGAVLLLWFLTGLVSVPLHNKLAKNYNAKLIDWLTLTNWPRTLLWTARSVALVLYFL